LTIDLTSFLCDNIVCYEMVHNIKQQVRNISVMAKNSTAKVIEQTTDTNIEVPTAAPVAIVLDAKGRKNVCDVSDESMTAAGAVNTSQRIRYLIGENYSPGAVAKRLGKRYQHVRNVMMQPLKKPV